MIRSCNILPVLHNARKKDPDLDEAFHVDKINVPNALYVAGSVHSNFYDICFEELKLVKINLAGIALN